MWNFIEDFEGRKKGFCKREKGYLSQLACQNLHYQMPYRISFVKDYDIDLPFYLLKTNNWMQKHLYN